MNSVELGYIRINSEPDSGAPGSFSRGHLAIQLYIAAETICATGGAPLSTGAAENATPRHM